MTTTVHAIKGVGEKLKDKSSDVFNPRMFHRGMTDLQEYMLDLNQLAEESIRVKNVDEEMIYDSFDEEDNSVILSNDSPIESVVNEIPKGWDVTVVLDANDKYSGFAGTVSRLSCGGGVEIWTTSIIRCGNIEEVSIEFTDLANLPDEENPGDEDTETPMIKMEKVNIPMNSSDLAGMMRAFSDGITAGYTHNISTATRAFDFSMCEPTPKNSISRKADDFYPISRTYWGKIRGTSRQTIFNNISKAGDELSKNGVKLHEDPIATQPNIQQGCLTQISPDNENKGHIRLV